MAKAAKNSIPGKSEPFLKRIETLMAEGESAKGTYMAECRERRGDIKEIYTEAGDAGVSKKALRGLVKYRELERKQNKIGDGLDIDEQAAYATLVEALGALGAAAARAAGYPAEEDASGDDDTRDLRPDSLKEAEKERADADALSKVGRGKEAAAPAG